MKRKNATRNALFTSIISLLLCVSMLVGTTFAWFTDEVTSANNKIAAGTLEIDLQVKGADGTYTSIKEKSEPIFNYGLWEPGYTEVANVKVVNDGSLALQYALQIVTEGLIDELLDNKIMLSDVIDVYYAAEEVILKDRAAFNAAVADGSLKPKGTLTDIIFGGTVLKDSLLAGKSDYATIVLHMQETAGNEYQNLSVGTKFDMKLFATQYTYEDDSFDNQYDKIDLPSATLMVMDSDMLKAYALDAGCVYLAAEEWDDAWDYDEANDKVADGTPSYAYYFADFVVSFDKSHAAGEVTLWGYYPSWGAEESFQMDAIVANEQYRVIATAADKLGIAMGDISYHQLLTDVQNFACGVGENSLQEGETITVTLRIYETALNGTQSFQETGVFHDVAVYTYTQGTR